MIVKGTVTYIGETMHLKRETSKDMYKKVVCVETDDEQTLYVDVINKRLNQLDNIEEGDVVEVDILFRGVLKNGKVHNNLFCSNIIKLK